MTQGTEVMERCVIKTPRHGRLWKVGECRAITDFDEDGDPVVTDHFRLVKKGEGIAPDDIHDPSLVAEKKLEMGLLDKRAGIEAALKKLDPDDDESWTQKGAPSIQRLHLISGTEITRSEVIETWPEFDRDCARALQKSDFERS